MKNKRGRKDASENGQKNDGVILNVDSMREHEE